MKRHHGFTLTELLITVSIIGLLSALLLPAIGKARSKTKATVCLNNHRSLSLAMALYVGESRGYFTPNVEAPFPEIVSTNWVAGHMGATDLRTEVILMRSPSRSLLHPYISANQTYACSARSLLKPRTLGLSSRINPTSVVLSNMWQWTPANEPPFEKMTDVLNPARTFTFIEESASSVGDAYFAVDHSGSGQPYATYSSESAFFADIPGASHSGATVVSFVDGHANLRLWNSTELRHDRLSPRSRPAHAKDDILWLREASLGTR